MKKLGYSAIAILTLAAGNAGAAGFEKAVMWSGKYAGMGAAATGSVSGSQSLFFNPAGLVGQSDVSLNYSPNWITSEGYLATSTKKEESDQGIIPMGGLFANYSWNKFAFGVGAYAAGGEKAIFTTVDLSGDSGRTDGIKPDLKTDLELTEYALGGAVELAPGLKLGAAWRITKAKGTLATVKKSTANSYYSFLQIKDAEDTRYTGYRVGALYEDSAKVWGVGAAYRSKQTFDAPGEGSGVTNVLLGPTAGSVSAQTVWDTRIGLVLPSMISVGGHYAFTDAFRVHAAVDFTKYSDDDNVYIAGFANGSKLPNIPLNWDDMWNYRLGIEYSGFDKLALRAGYVRVSQVTNEKDAKATLPPPGVGQLLTAGAGYSVTRSLDLDGAFEYGFNKGEGYMTLPTGSTKELLAGVKTETKATTMAVHTGLTYRF